MHSSSSRPSPCSGNQIDFEALKAKFESGRKRTEAEKLKAALTLKINAMVRLNQTRMDFLEKLQEMIEQAEKLVLDWRKRQQSRAAVKLAIEEELDRLPEAFTARLYEQKCASIYQHVYDSYFGRGKSIYAATVRARLAPGPRD